MRLLIARLRRRFTMIPGFTGIPGLDPIATLRKLRREPMLLRPLRFWLVACVAIEVIRPGALIDYQRMTAIWTFLQGMPTRVWVGVGVALAVLVVLRGRKSVKDLALREPRSAVWWIVPVALLIGGAAAMMAWWLLAGTPDRLSPYQMVTARRGAVQTALGAGAGAGAAVTLMLAFRRQRHQEIANLMTAHDATERRVTELYTKAVEQLGSDKAAVRLGGLYALERLAQDNPEHRQTVVNVVCAYLRMPYAPPGRFNSWRQPETPGNGSEEELQVRLTAQYILGDHLRDDRPLKQRASGSDAGPRFWEGMRIDLAGAVLINLDFRCCRADAVRFSGVTFVGVAQFEGAVFAWNALFVGAMFVGDAQFDGAALVGGISFAEARFVGGARFSGATFAGGALFVKTAFTQCVAFDGATFAGGTWFDGATFAGGVLLEGAISIPGRVSPGFTMSGVDHVWPEGWRVVAQADGAGRLEREAKPGPVPTA